MTGAKKDIWGSCIKNDEVHVGVHRGWMDYTNTGLSARRPDFESHVKQKVKMT